MTIEEMYGNAKALVEDRTYNIGEISETTGLQKTANGWVKPKGNKNNKQQVVANKEKIINSFKTDAENMATEQLKYKLEDLNNGKDIGYGMLEEQKKIYKAELEKRNSNSAQEELIKLEKERRNYGDDSKNDYADHKIRLKQADLLNKAGFKDRKEFDKFYENQNKTTDSACRITADTKIRLKK